MRYDIVGISEVRWTGSGELMNGRMVFAGEERKHEKGVAIVMSERAHKALIGYLPISPRVMAARFRGDPFNLTVIQAYAPTADSTDEEVEEFYEQVEEGLQYAHKRDIRIVMGD